MSWPTHPLASSAALTAIIQGTCFLITYAIEADIITDFAGSINTVIIAVVSLALSKEPRTRQYLATAAGILWGVRIAAYLLYRILVTKKDDRFDGMRGKFIPLLRFWIFQAIWTWTITIPIVLVNDYSSTLVPQDYAFIIIWVFGFIVESLADQQKLSHRLKRVDAKDFMRGGLWSWSRHPNYFGEIIMWWAVYLFSAADVGFASIGLASPLFTMAILLGLSGLPYSERPTGKKQFEAGNWQAYSEYFESTSPLVLVPPAVWKRLPYFIKFVLFEYPIYRFTPPEQ